MHTYITTATGRQLRLGLIATTLGLLAGCAVNPNPSAFPEPVREPLAALPQSETLQSGSAGLNSAEREGRRFERTPGQQQGVQIVEPDGALLGEDLTGEPIGLNINNLPLPAFINEVFGNRLGLSFTLTPELQQKNDLVTLRMNEPQPPAALFNTARNVLADYGVEVRLRDGLYAFGVSTTQANDTLPLLVSGRALPEVPMSHRPVFQLVPVRVVNSNQMELWLKDMFASNSELKISQNITSNTVMLRGPVELVKQALAAIELFDQPAMKGSHSISVTPVYSKAEELGNALIKVLQAEGYNVSDNPPLGSVLVLKLAGLQRLVIFAADPAILAHARQWVQVLDRESQEQVENGLFVYQVRNTQAAAIATMLGALGYSATVPDTGVNSSNTRPAGDEGSSGLAGSQAATGTKTLGQGERGSVVVDPNRNAIIFQGSGQEWVRLRPLLGELDQAVPSVMIDVLLAEVSLNDREGLGVDWRNVRTDFGSRQLIMGTANGLGTSGLNLALNSAGETRAALNAFYENRQAVIRSSPKLMVRSGEEARIEVGNEIPVVTGTSQSTDGGNSPINKTVQYRKTGVILTIKPTVQASGLVDLAISQELSEQTDTSAGGDDLTPTIMNRKVETALTLRDGGSVMLAGLISSSKGSGDTGVPLLGDIPWLGSLFKSKSASEDRTELVVMIIPYVLRDHQEAQDLTERYRRQLELNNATLIERRTLHLPQP